MRWLCPTLLAAGLCAADAPLVTVTVPDGARMRERFAASIYGQIWNDPSFASTRDELVADLDETWQEVFGLGFSEAVVAFRSAHAVLDGIRPGQDGEDPLPQVRVQADLGEAAKPIFDAWREGAEGEAAAVPDAEAGFFLAEGDLEATIGLFGTIIAAATDGVPAPLPVPVSDDDFAYDFDSQALLAALEAVAPEGDRAEIANLREVFAPHLGTITYAARFIESGMWERTHLTANALWLVPVDRQQLGRYPATTLGAIGIGFDGVELWPLVEGIIAAEARKRGRDVAEEIARIDQDIADEGFTFTFKQLIEGLTGTWSLAVTQSAPFPAGSLTVPRTPVVDALVTKLVLDAFGTEVPAEGGTLMLPIPNMPLPIVLARDARAWLVTSDSLFVNDWLAGVGGGFLETPAAKLATEKGGDGALIFGASDTAATLRTLTPFAALGLGQLPIDPGTRQTVNGLLAKAARLAKTGYVVVRPEDEGLTMEMQGTFTYFTTYVGTVGAALGFVHQQRQAVAFVEDDLMVEAVEEGPVLHLRAGILPAMAQFQGGGYHDLDQDGIGQYGFFTDMADGAVVQGIELTLLSADFFGPEPVVDGYRFRIYLPAQDGTGTTEAAKVDGDAAERRWIAYAWPADDADDTVYAIDQAGVVYRAEWDGEAPAWNALYGGGTWEDPAVWEVVGAMEADWPEFDPETPPGRMASELLPALVIFQANVVLDSDGDGIGEYPLLGEASGATPIPAAGDLDLLDPAWKGGDEVVRDGYRYKVWVGQTPATLVANAAERKGKPTAEGFLVVAWPAEGNEGSMYAMTVDGEILTAGYSGTAPEPATVFTGDGTWTATDAWQPVQP